MILLTILTVVVSSFDFGAWNTIIALLIAAAKALVVVTWFMHVKYSTRLTKVFVGAGFVWLLVLILILSADYTARGWL